MVGVINPSGDLNFESFRAAAELAPSNVAPTKPPARTAVSRTSAQSSSSPTSSAQTSPSGSPTSPAPNASTTGPGQQSAVADGESGFSRGTQLGVGIGVAIVVALIAICAAGWFFWRRRNRRRKAAQMAAFRASFHQKPELDSVPVSASPKPAQPWSVYELDSSERRAELGGMSRSESGGSARNVK